MLTSADIKRPDVLRLNRIINSVTAIVWFPLAVWRKALFGIFSFFDWLFDSSFTQAMEFRDWLLAAYVKRWPTPLRPGDPLYAFSQSREMPDTACKVVKFRRYGTADAAPLDTGFMAELERGDDMIMTPVFRCHRHGGYGFVSDCEVCSKEIAAESARMQDPARNKFHPANWSAPMPISEARKADPLVEEAMQKLARGEISLS